MKMDVIALVSGGKDSCYNMMQCVAEGHKIVALANLKPADKDELDSYMYQTVGHHAIELYAEAMALPLYRRTIQGSPLEQDRVYKLNPADEVEDLYELLKEVKEKTNATAVSVGAILSDYQRVRVEHVCMRLGLTPLAYLWRREQEALLKEMIDCGVDAVLIKVAALGLDPKLHLGRTLEEIFPHMQKMQSKYGLNVCGEGGEYETFTLDCPLFKKRLVLDESSTVLHADDAFAPVAYMNLNAMHLEEKPGQDLSQHDRMKDLPMTTSKTLLKDLGFDDIPQPPVRSGVPACEAIVQKPLANCPKVRVSQSGDTVYICGVYGMGSKDKIEEATQQAVTQLKDTLKMHKLSLGDLAAVHLYVADMSQFHRINAIYKGNFAVNPPIRVCVEVPLPENVALQMDCVATRQPRSTMHVQGLSHWAPANIGPYSQAVLMDTGHLHVAGQIGMTPSDLSIIRGGPSPQARLSLRHTSRVLTAMSAGCQMRDLDLALCYVTDPAFVPAAEAEWAACSVGEPACQALVAYIVVPALPKGADVEWQVCGKVQPSDQNNGDTQEVSISARTHLIANSSYNMMTENLKKKDTVTATRITITATGSNATEEEATGETLVPELIKAYNFVMTERFQCATILHVFFNASCLQHNDLQEVYEKTVSSTSSTPSVQFTPVLGFKNENCVITAIC